MWKISVVNDHVLSIAGIDKCVLYDITQQKELKSLSYDYGRAGFLSMKISLSCIAMKLNIV